MKIKKYFHHPMLKKRKSPNKDTINVFPGPIVERYIHTEKNIIRSMRWLAKNLYKMKRYKESLSTSLESAPLTEALVAEFDEYIHQNFPNQMESERGKLRNTVEMIMNALYDERLLIWRKDAIYEFIIPFFGKTGKVPYPYSTVFPMEKIDNHIIGFIDIDYLKCINDQKGHIYADMVLRQVFKIINETVMKYNGMAFRYGGDEVVLWFSTDMETAKKAVIELRKKIAEIEVERYIIKEGRHREWITLSVGLTEINGTFEKTLDIADELAYISKRGKGDITGRDSITINDVRIGLIDDSIIEEWKPVKFREFIDFRKIERKYRIEMRGSVPVLVDKNTGKILDELAPSKSNGTK